MKSVYSTSEWNCFKNYILNDFYIERPIVDSIVTMLDRSNLRFLYTTSRNNDEKIIDLWDNYFKKGTIQIIKRRDNQETTFTFIQFLRFHFYYKLCVILEVVGTQMTFG